jgi:hypothetical protein
MPSTGEKYPPSHLSEVVSRLLMRIMIIMVVFLHCVFGVLSLVVGLMASMHAARIIACVLYCFQG